MKIFVSILALLTLYGCQKKGNSCRTCVYEAAYIDGAGNWHSVSKFKPDTTVCDGSIVSHNYNDYYRGSTCTVGVTCK